MEISKYSNKKVAILGYGIEGQSAYKFLAKNGCEIDIFDESQSEDLPDDATVAPVEDWELNDYDLVVRAPGIALHRIKSTSKLTSLTEIFFELCTAPIIGVTGTKGKGTTATLIAEILKKSGKSVHLLGNIGLPALDELEHIESNDSVVYELSSFQLWDLDISPHIAVVLMIEPEHLDVHQDEDDYLDAKKNITAHQTNLDVTIYHPFNELSAKIALNGQGEKKKFMSEDTARISFGDLFYGNNKIMETADFGLIGPHNRENICAAVSAAMEVEVDFDAVRGAVKEFKGLEHRLEYVREIEGVKFYNDSFATTPGASLAAINSFDSPEIIILGGSDKGANYDDLAEAIATKNNIKQVLLIGKMADEINASLASFDFKNVQKVDGDMENIVSTAKQLAREGDVILLSPACASFDMFENYKQRGNIFKKVVGEL